MTNNLFDIFAIHEHYYYKITKYNLQKLQTLIFNRASESSLFLQKKHCN